MEIRPKRGQKLVYNLESVRARITVHAIKAKHLYLYKIEIDP